MIDRKTILLACLAAVFSGTADAEDKSLDIYLVRHGQTQ
jgi:hypothetical protein